MNKICWRKVKIRHQSAVLGLPIFGVWTFDVFAFFEVSLQVHGEQRRAGGVVWASHGPVVTAGLMFSANRCWDDESRKCFLTGYKQTIQLFVSL